MIILKVPLYQSRDRSRCDTLLQGCKQRPNIESFKVCDLAWFHRRRHKYQILALCRNDQVDYWTFQYIPCGMNVSAVITRGLTTGNWCPMKECQYWFYSHRALVKNTTPLQRKRMKHRLWDVHSQQGCCNYRSTSPGAGWWRDDSEKQSPIFRLYIYKYLQITTYFDLATATLFTGCHQVFLIVAHSIERSSDAVVTSL